MSFGGPGINTTGENNELLVDQVHNIEAETNLVDQIISNKPSPSFNQSAKK